MGTLLHHLFTRLEYAIAVHPDVPDSARQPDFELSRGAERLYVEAAVVFSGVVDEQRDAIREGWIMDAVNRGTSSNFHVRIEFEHVGERRPRDRDIYRPVEDWLAALDPDEVSTEYSETGELPAKAITVDDWRLRFEAIPVKPGARGDKDSGRLLGMGPVSGGFVDDKEQLRDTLKRKRGRYGTPEIPLVVAVNCASSCMKNEDIASALYGSIAVQYQVDVPGTAKTVRLRDGTWISESGPRGQRMSAVLSAVQLHPWTAVRATPQLWHNPSARVPLDAAWPLTTWRCSEQGLVSNDDREVDMADLLNLPAGWPGREDPFDSERRP